MTLGESFPSVLAAARAGADWAWAEIYRDLAGPLTGYLASRGAREPEDLASETFLHVARGLHRFIGDEVDFRSWVFVIAHRRLQDERRRTSRRAVAVHDGDGDALTRDMPSSDDVEAHVVSMVSEAEVMSLLEGLTEQQRDVLMLRIVADLSLEQTAQVMARKPNAIKALQHRALVALQKKTSRNP